MTELCTSPYIYYMSLGRHGWKLKIRGNSSSTSGSSSLPFLSPCLCSGVDILKLVAAQVGTQWIDIYQSLANATEREVAAFSNGYSSDHERAYAALQHWTIRDSDANLAKLINALHRQRRIDVVEKVRCIMEDNPQVGWMDVLGSFRDDLIFTSTCCTHCSLPTVL